jgi:hypothetical protein
MKRDEVRAELGEPDSWGGASRKYRCPRIAKYGDVELHFGQRAEDGLLSLFAEDADGEEFLSLHLPTTDPA